MAQDAPAVSPEAAAWVANTQVTSAHSDLPTRAAAAHIIELVILTGTDLRALNDWSLARFKADAVTCAKAVLGRPQP